jgi:hypothetical protein
MRLRAFLSAVAMLPAALNIAPTTAHGLNVPICAGAEGGTVTLPIPASGIPGKEMPGCCAKGCHTGQRKKNHARQFDTGQ